MLNYHELIITLRENGLRLTPQRIAICRYLAESNEHPTALQIFNNLKEDYPSLSLATVYNTLDVLVTINKIKIFGPSLDGKMHFDTNKDTHINMICTQCKNISDLSIDKTHLFKNEIKKHTDFKITGAMIIYYGICPACQGVNKKNNNI